MEPILTGGKRSQGRVIQVVRQSLLSPVRTKARATSKPNCVIASLRVGWQMRTSI